MPHGETIRAYLAAIEAGADIAPFFAPGAEQREYQKSAAARAGKKAPAPTINEYA
jgi:hypothetical protein